MDLLDDEAGRSWVFALAVAWKRKRGSEVACEVADPRFSKSTALALEKQAGGCCQRADQRAGPEG